MFEQLVRPFAARPVTNSRKIVPVVIQESVETAAITWGVSGTLPTEVAQPSATTLENIMAVGFNIRGSVDKFNQSSRRSEFVDVPIRDEGGTQIGTTTVDRVKSITYSQRNRVSGGANPNTVNTAYLPNFTGVAGSAAPTGLRAAVPANDVSQITLSHSYSPSSDFGGGGAISGGGSGGIGGGGSSGLEPGIPGGGLPG